MLSINFEKFSEFYHSNIEPQLIDLEKERKKLRLYFCLNNIFTALMFFLLLATMLFPIISMTLWNGIFVNNVFFIGIPFFISAFLLNFSLLLKEKLNKKLDQYIRKFKTKIHAKIFKLLNLDYKPSASPEFADYQNAALKYISKDKRINIKIFTYIMRFEDGISGIFKDIPFELCDATVIKQHKIKSEIEKAEVPVFKGLMLAVNLNKNFKNETVINQIISNFLKLIKILLNLRIMSLIKGSKCLQIVKLRQGI